MYYWNQDNFEGLNDIAEEFSKKQGYENFSRYCLLREKGLKKSAFVELQLFIEQCRGLSLSEQRHVAVELTELYFHNGHVHSLLSHPLLVYIKSIFKEWCEENPKLAMPYRWYAFVSGDSGFFERALAIDPSDEISLSRIIMYELGYVDFATHHLSESIFLGDEAISEVALAKANAYMIRLPDSDSKAEHQADINYFRSLLDAWRAYQASNKQKTFPEWSGEKGYKFSFSIIYYYGK